MTPIRPTGRDLSLKNTNSTYFYRWFPLSSSVPHTASQTEKDMMEWALFAKTLEVMRVLGHVAPQALKYAASSSGLMAITTRLGIGSQYEGQLVKKGGAVWEVGPKGRHYSIEFSILKKFRAEVFKKPAAVTALASHPDLRDLLDLNLACNGPAEFTFGKPPTKVDGVREDAFPVTTKKRMPLLTPSQISLLKETHAAHHAVSKWRKDPQNVPPPPPGIVQYSHDVFEASARDEEELHFFQVKPFSGYEHPGWTREELGILADIQDVYHHQWMDRIIQGDWRGRQDDTAHLWSHVLMNIGPHPTWEFRFPCPESDHIDNCDDFTPRATISILRKRLGV